MKLTDTLINMPDSALVDITVKPPEPPSGGGTSAPAPAATNAQGTVSTAEALAGTQHTKISSLFDTGVPAGGGVGTPISPMSATAPVGQLLDAKLVVGLWDELVPGLLVALLYKAGLDTLRKSELQFTAKEKDILTPIVAECLKTLMVNMSNPWSALALSLGIIYAGKIGEKGVVAWLDKQNAETAKKAANEALQTMQENGSAKPADLNSAFDLVGAEFSDDLIKATMKNKKYSRERAILFLHKNKAKYK